MTEERDPFDTDGLGDDDGLAKVDLEFATLRDFREQMAPYLGDRGFFARSERPLPRDTPVHFRFVLPEGFALAEGTAVVAWNIEPESHPDLIPGMALRFVDVGKQSRSVIRELVDFHIATGGDPFDLGPSAGGEPGEIPTDSLDSSQPEPVSDFDFPPVSASVDAEEAPTASRHDEVLPDWLSEATDPERFDFGTDPGRRDHDEPGSEAAEVVGEPGPAEFEVDMIFDDTDADRTPLRPPIGSVRDAIDIPRSAHEPPRDIRLGLIVAAGLAVVAVAVLVWSLWLRPQQADPPEVVEIPVEDVEPGIEIVPDGEETPPDEGPTKIFVAEEPPQEAAPVGRPATEAQRPPASPPVTDQPEAQAPALQGPANRILEVVASARQDVTTVVVRGNGMIDERAVKIQRLDDPDRIWLRIFNIETFYKPNEIPVGSPEVLQVRVGYHPEENPPALYVVIDLTDPSVVLKDSEVAGDSIRLSVGRR